MFPRFLAAGRTTLSNIEIPKVVPGKIEYVSDSDITDAADAVVEAAFVKAKEMQDTITGYPFPSDSTGLGMGPLSDEKIRELLEWIPGRFERYLTPDPAVFDYTIAQVGKVANEFGTTGSGLRNSDRGAFFTAKHNAGLWKGNMAEKFNANFLGPIEGIMENHGRVATLLHNEIEKTKAVYLNRRKTAKEVADKTVEAIEAIALDGGITVMLAFLISAGTVLTLGGGGFAVAGAALIIGGTIGGPLIPGDGESVPLSADSVGGVLDNMRAALDSLDESIKGETDTLNEAMKETDKSVYPEVFDADGQETKMLPMRPNLLDASPEQIKAQFFKYS